MLRRLGLSLATLALASTGVVALAPPAAYAAQAGSEAGAGGDTLFPRQGDARYQVRSYDVSLDYTPVTNRLTATTRIVAVAARDLGRFDLDLEGLDVSRVLVDGEQAAFSRDGHELTVRPDGGLDRGRFTVRVDYAGEPQEHIDPDGSTEGWVRTADGAAALGEPVGTMTWIPSNNTPGDKARYTFRLTVPTGYEATANGVLVSQRDEGLTTTWTWRADDPMATYLAMVSIGQFDVFESQTESVDGRTIPIWSFTDVTGGDAAAARRLLPKVIAFQERLFGPYPFDAAGLVVDDADVGYALETQTRPFYPSVGAADGALVHETAHQWFGDSVTLVDWHDIWLAEGFATYAEWLWDARHGGDTAQEHFDDLYATPASGALWRPAPTEFTDAADLFGSPVYNRGAMTLHALRKEVGGDDFFRIVRLWAQRNEDGSVRTAQLVRLAERVSGRELSPLFRTWLEKAGKPAGY